MEDVLGAVENMALMLELSKPHTVEGQQALLVE